MYLSLIFLPFLSFLFTISFARFLERSTIIRLNLIGLCVAIFLALISFYEVVLSKTAVVVSLGSWINTGPFNISWTFLFDPLSVTMICLVLIISTLVHFYSWEYMGGDPHFIRFISYLSIFTFFMLLFVSAGNFLQMFFGWEGVGLSSYLLINFWYTRLQANKSAMKAIIVNRISDLCLYFSLFLMFYIFETLDYAAIFAIMPLSELGYFWATLICLGIFLGAVGKSAQLGLHTWLPDAMEGPTPVSALLHAATMVTAGVFLLIRCGSLLEYASDILLLTMFIGGLTTFFAGSIGCFQNDVKKIIAYSTCSQLGYMFLVCGLSQYSTSFFHLFNHAFFKALLFLGAGSIIHALMDEQDIRKMGGLFYSLPITYISFFLASLALMGIPYLTGFYSKDLLIELTFFKFGLSSLFLYWLALCSVFFTAFYSTRLAWYVFFGYPNARVSQPHESGNIILFVLITLSIASMWIGFTFKDLFVGPASDSWQNSINIVERNIFFDTELGFIFGGTYALNKIFPLIITILGCVIAFILLSVWNAFIQNNLFRSLYEFINQKWYFDVIYFNFVITPIMTFSYYITFKMIDRGVLEFAGSTSLSQNLYSLSKGLNFYESGYLYAYGFMQVVALLLVTFLLAPSL